MARVFIPKRFNFESGGLCHIYFCTYIEVEAGVASRSLNPLKRMKAKAGAQKRT